MCSIKSTHTNCSSSEWTEFGFVLAATGVLHGPGSQSPEVHDYLQGQWIIRARLESPEQTLLWWWTVWSLTLESADRNPWSHGQLPDQGGHIQSNPKSQRVSSMLADHDCGSPGVEPPHLLVWVPETTRRLVDEQGRRGCVNTRAKWDTGRILVVNHSVSCLSKACN